jgi:hypothetical protein
MELQFGDKKKGKFKVSKKTLLTTDVIDVKSATGDNSQLSYEDLLSQLTTDIGGGGGGGATFREIYKYQILLNR